MGLQFRWILKPDGQGGYTGTLLIPGSDVDGSPVSVKATATGQTKADAFGKAANLATKIADNPIVASLLPPGSGLALKATLALAKAAKSGQLGAVAKQFAGPGMKRLGSALGKAFG